MHRSVRWAPVLWAPALLLVCPASIAQPAESDVSPAAAAAPTGSTDTESPTVGTEPVATTASPATDSAPAPSTAPATEQPATPAARTPPPPPPPIDLRTPAPPPPTPRGRHLHDGFYLRMTVGPAFLSTRVDYDDGSELDLSGTGFAMDLLLGGTPSPGLTIGGGLWLGSIDEPTVETDITGYEASTGVAYGLVGPFVDAYFGARGNVHLGGAVGISFVALPQAPDPPAGVTADEEQTHLSSGGGGICLFGGYDSWISENWSLGVLLRLLASQTRQENDELLPPYETVNRSFAVLFSALYH